MILRELFRELPKATVSGPLDAEVVAVTADSREVAPGSVFVAVRGHAADGHRFIGDALAGGAAAVVAERAPGPDEDRDAAWAHVADSRESLARLADALAGRPTRELLLAGVTGTNGKTTTAFLLHHLMSRLWHRAGLLGTVSVHDGMESRPAGHTTPGPVELQQLLRTMVDNGCRGAVMEVSSHGIDQRRVTGVAFDVAVFTNLSQDHLDYHGTLERYFAAKRSWFEALAADPLGKQPVAVVNLDDSHGAELAEALAGRMEVVGYGFGVRAGYRAENFHQSAEGSQFGLQARGRSTLVRTPLIGRFNVYNTLAAIAAADVLGMRLREVIHELAAVPQVPGRMERIGQRDGVSVFVDYAHTPDALENACRALRELEPRRLVTVFGCGGDRDRGKRPMMAAAVARHSDACVITSDNPRGEDPERILDDIERGLGACPHARIVDRAEAIDKAVAAAGKGDIVLVAGKGHETRQQFADRTIDFDDRSAARRALFVERAKTHKRR
jgi:UDP-N-acetylmuramoyl-L-alanyl-D-glutamate--2,6-diaminopimelate ligase